ncbi:MAG: MBL fold metallo-hydrolase [Armatimonadetes bacterium]|nr:MBL fold metallo-hydrolase [Armatimonadota bacterium]
MSSVSLDYEPGRQVARSEKVGARHGFSVRFRGVRGSYAVPGRGTTGIGGNTPCVEVRVGGHILIFDAGTGIIELGRELVAEHLGSGTDAESRKPLTCTLFFSHMHHDHTQGFPFFAPVFLRGAVLHILGPRLARQDLEEALTKALLTPFFPVDLDEMAAEMAIRNLEDDEIVVLPPDSSEPRLVNATRSRPALTPDHVVVRNLRGYSHPSGIRFYRVEYGGRSVVYATDTEGYVGGDVNLSLFAAGADVLIHDAQYRESEYVGRPVPTQGYGHSTPAMAAAVAAAAGVGRLVLFHHDPRHDDGVVAVMEADARRLFANSAAAYEGMSIDLL